MEDVPEVLFLDIFSFLAISELFSSLSKVNQLFNKIIKSEALLDTVIKHRLRLNINQRLPSNKCIQLLKECMNYTRNQYLEFIACSTDGGIYEENENNFFGHVFEYNKKLWCTVENISNVNASGILSNTQEGVIGYH